MNMMPNPGSGGGGGTLSSGTFSAAGGAVSDLFGYFGTQSKAAGDLTEAQDYTEAATLADQNEQFTAMSTGIKLAQQNREITKSLGTTQADVAGAGFAASGSAMDILRDSAAQGALTKSVISEQGLITEAGYKEQAASYTNMASAATAAAGAEGTAGIGKLIGAGIDIASIAAAPFTGGASLALGALASGAVAGATGGGS